LILIELLIYFNLSICLSAVLRTEETEMRIKPPEFHLAPAEASKTLATAYGESWIRSNPG